MDEEKNYTLDTFELKETTKIEPLGDCRFRFTDDGEERVLRFAIRKLTPRECFRLMDVSEDDIDKIQTAGISKSQQYKLAGNSIVVSCLTEIFKQLFCPEPPKPVRGMQLSLF